MLLLSFVYVSKKYRSSKKKKGAAGSLLLRKVDLRNGRKGCQEARREGREA